MTNKPRSASKLFILSWLLVPIIALWITTNYIIGLGRKPTWNAAANQELITQVEQTKPSVKQFEWQHTGLVTLWFDDAWSTQFTTGYPQMEQRQLKGALAVPTNAVGTNGYMGWSQAKLMQYKGWEITSHSQSHNCTAKDLTTEYEEKELGGAKRDLASHGLAADNYVPPCGTITPAVTAAAKKNYSSLRTSYGGVNSLPLQDVYNLKVHTLLRDTSIEEVNDWLNEAKQQNAWLILVFHQIDNSTTQYGMNEGSLKNILDAVTASKLPVVLPNQVLQMKVAQ